MEAKQLALQWKDILPSVFHPFRVGYQTQTTDTTQYHQDGIISSVMTLFVLVSFGVAASFGNIMSSENVKPIRVYALEVSLCLYLSVGILVLLMLNCSNNIRRQISITKRIPRNTGNAGNQQQQQTVSSRFTRDNVLYCLPLVGMLVFMFSVWIVDVIRILSYSECMDDYRKRDSRELYNEGGAAVTYHIARAVFSLLVVVFTFNYHRTEVILYRSLKMRFMLVVVIACLFWLGFDALLHHASDEFDDAEPYTSYDDNHLNYTCTTQMRNSPNRTIDEECFCKDTHMFRMLKQAGAYLYPVNVEFSLLALEYVLFLFFTAIPKEKAVLPKTTATKPAAGEKVATAGAAAEPAKRTSNSHVAAMEEQAPPLPRPDQTMLELQNIPTTDSDTSGTAPPQPEMRHNPSCNSFQFEDYAMMCVLNPGAMSCGACIAKHASIQASLGRCIDRRSSQQDTLASVSNSVGSVRFENVSTRGSSLCGDARGSARGSSLGGGDARGSARGSFQIDGITLPVPMLLPTLEHTCESATDDRIASLSHYEVDTANRNHLNPILMSYNANNNVALPSLRLHTPEDMAGPTLPEASPASDQAPAKTSDEQAVASSAAAQAAAIKAQRDVTAAEVATANGANVRLEKIDEQASRTTVTMTPTPQVSSRFEADTEVVVDSIHLTEGESQNSSLDKKQSVIVSVKEKLCDQWLLLTISCSVAIVYLVFAVVTSNNVDDNSVGAAMVVFLVYKTMYVVFTCVVVWFGFHCCRTFATNQRGYRSFEIVILLMSLAIFINCLLSMFGAVAVLKMSHSEYQTLSDDPIINSDVKQKAGFIIAGSIFTIIEVYLQTMFMFRCVSIVAPDASQPQYKLYAYFKQVLLYLIPVNGVFWIVDSFVIHNPDTLLTFGLDYFDESTYSIVTLLLGPFMLYYRFNLCLYYVKIYLTTKPDCKK